MSSPTRARTLCGSELGDPEATAIAVRNLAEYKDNGYRIRRDWDSRGPEPYIVRHPGGHTLRWRHWIDHVYRITGPDGTKIYASEPYGLRTDDLVELAQDGWDVCIGQSPLWFPGCTTPILMKRKPR